MKAIKIYRCRESRASDFINIFCSWNFEFNYLEPKTQKMGWIFYWTSMYRTITVRDRNPNHLIIGWDHRCILDNKAILEFRVFMRRTCDFAEYMTTINFWNLVEDGRGMTRKASRRGACWDFVGRLDRRRPLWIPGHRWEDNIRIDFQDVEYEGKYSDTSANEWPC